ncbi:hypothetical protein [Streptomyces sp. NPDC059909]|uniref:hypothetical protein n=1 Tax=Streptomyces sp. NPDC059909 TaxID=3346998 RepID=UPI003648F20A
MGHGRGVRRRFAAAAAPYLAPKIAEWTDVRAPFVVAGVAAVIGAVIVGARRASLTHEAAAPKPVLATREAVLAD